MEVLNKLMPLLMAVTISVNLSGCGNKAGAESGYPVETSSSTPGTLVTELPDDYDPTTDMSLKEPCWEDFSKITICGREFNIPCEPEDFDGDFAFVGTEKEHPITYKEELIGAYTLYDKDESDYSYCFSVFGATPTIPALFSVKDVTSDMSYIDVINCFGRPSRISVRNGKVYTVVYNFDDMEVRINILHYDSQTQELMISYFI